MVLRVLSAGTARSGSTWLINATLALLEQQGSVYGDWCERWNEAKAAGMAALVLKVHGADQVGAFAPDVIATCHRDLRDVALSQRDYHGLDADEAILGSLAWARTCHDHFAPLAHIDLAYEQMVEAPLVALEQLAGALRLEHADIGAARAKVEAWQPLPGDAQHRFDGRPGRWREQLSAPLRRAIEDAHGDWLARYGYL